MERLSRFGNYKPEDFIVDIVDDLGNTSKYMKNQGRIIAFRNEYPEGKIRIEVQFFSDILLFMAKAYIYADKTDHMDNYLACDVGSRIFKDNNSLPEATTQAISRALGRCGFGTTYASPDETDGLGNLSEASVPPKDNTSADDADTGTEQPKRKRGRPRKTETGSVKTVDAESVEQTKEVVEEPTSETTPASTLESPVTKEANAPSEPENPENKSENLENMTLEEARKVMIPFGQKKGQFMGEVFATDPNAVRWYSEKYSGDNELVRKAAQVILAAQK